MKIKLLWFLLVGSYCFAQSVPCVSTACSLTINYPFDSVGFPDTRPGTWGTTAFDDGKIVFQNVPKGYLVNVQRVYGNWTVRLHCPTFPAPCPPVPYGLYSGALFGLISTGSTSSPYATLSASDCLLYFQADVGPGESKIVNFDAKTQISGTLQSDNTLIVRRAIYLNETSWSIHMEPSFVVEFKYIPNGI